MTALGDENVGWLDVAMNDALSVRGIESVSDFDANVEQNFHIERTAQDEVFESLAVKEFHGNEGTAIFLADVVNCANVGMIQGRGSLRLSLEPRQSLCIVRDTVW